MLRYEILFCFTQKQTERLWKHALIQLITFGRFYFDLYTIDSAIKTVTEHIELNEFMFMRINQMQNRTYVSGSRPDMRYQKQM